MAYIIKNVKIITEDEKDTIIDKGYIIIDGTLIKEVGHGEYKGNIENAVIIDGKDHAVIPGIINCHTHAAMTLLRGYGEGLPLMRWLNEKIWPMEAKFNSEHIIKGTKIAIIEMIRSGTTMFNDMYFFQEEVYKVAKEMNMRAVLGIPLIGEGWDKQLKSAEVLSNYIENNEGEQGIIKTMFAPHSPYTLSKEALIEIGNEAKRCDKSIHIHVSETIEENNIIYDKYKKTPVELLQRCGIFDNKVVAAHGVHLNDNDLEIIKSSNANIVYNPQSNMKLASGVARVCEMLSKGINVCLGTDGTSSNNNLNMFEEMETAALLQNLWYKDATALSSRDTLKMATINGARALEYNNLGCIKKDYLADLVLIDINKSNMIPINDIVSNIVFSANGSEVDYVFINGKLVLNKGEFVEIDEEKIKYECKEIHSALMK